MKPTREARLANRAALEAALADDVKAVEGARGSLSASVFFRTGPEAPLTAFHLVHDTGFPAYGQTGERRHRREVVRHVGTDASFRTERMTWETGARPSPEGDGALARARREILAYFSPDGAGSEAETVALLDAAFERLREAAETQAEPTGPTLR